MDDRVALSACAEYETHRVEEAVRRAVALLGGMEEVVRPGQRVVVKPNLVLPSDPARAVITHPAVVRAVVRLVQEAGGSVLIADNPCLVPVSRRGWQTAFERSGWAAVAAETGAELNAHIRPEQHPYPEGRLIKLVDVSSFVTEADVLISVPKLKTHGLMRFTGAVKNLFGVVPGATKFGYHVKLQPVDRFAEMLLDLAGYVKPALTIMDAVVGMDGHGPSAGDPYPIGAILAGTDPVAVDVAAVGLVGTEPATVPTIGAAVRRGLTTGRVEDLALLGDSFSGLRVSGFRMPAGGVSILDRVPVPLRGLGKRHLVAWPEVTARCVGCGLCIDNCPAQTIARVNGRARINLDNCIRCYCCHEMCPEQAIRLRQPLVGRALALLNR